jgi:hypothetical protein
MVNYIILNQEDGPLKTNIIFTIKKIVRENIVASQKYKNIK